MRRTRRRADGWRPLRRGGSVRVTRGGCCVRSCFLSSPPSSQVPSVVDPRADEDRLRARDAIPVCLRKLHTLAATWHELDSFDDHVFRRWLENSLLYAFGATALTLATALPAGYGLAIGKFRGRRNSFSRRTMVAMLVPGDVARAPDLPRAERPAPARTMLSVVLPFSFFPFGGLPRVPLLLDLAPGRTVRRGAARRLRRVQVFLRVAVPLGKPDRRAHRLLQPSWPTGRTSSCPTWCSAIRRSFRSRSGSSTS